MKLAQVLLKQVIPGSGPFTTACLKADKGFDMTFEAGIVTATHKDGETQCIPLGNIVSMKPLPGTLQKAIAAEREAVARAKKLT